MLTPLSRELIEFERNNQLDLRQQPRELLHKPLTALQFAQLGNTIIYQPHAPFYVPNNMEHALNPQKLAKHLLKKSRNLHSLHACYCVNVVPEMYHSSIMQVNFGEAIAEIELSMTGTINTCYTRGLQKNQSLLNLSSLFEMQAIETVGDFTTSIKLEDFRPQSKLLTLRSSIGNEYWTATLAFDGEKLSAIFDRRPVDIYYKDWHLSGELSIELNGRYIQASNATVPVATAHSDTWKAAIGSFFFLLVKLGVRVAEVAT